MDRDYSEVNIGALAKHLRDGSKLNSVPKLGLEVEHIIVHRESLRAVTYYEPYGIEWILKSLEDNFPKSYRDGKELLGLYNSDYSISIEPAGQFEISVVPKAHIETIEEIYEGFAGMVNHLIRDKGYLMLAIGYQPRSLAGELPIIPKRRYEYMDRYFSTSGSRGRNMMRGTAATQVSIDYSGEADFVNKYRAAYLIMPALKLLSDNTPVFEGARYEDHIARTKIWDNVDPKRCGILPGLFAGDFGFRAYARYLYDMPPIFIPTEAGLVYTDRMTARELYAHRKLTDPDIEHLLSMAFPDVRAKHYIEIRGADSMPFEHVMSYMALLKGLLFHASTVRELLARYPIAEDDIRRAQTSIAEHGYGGTIYGRPAQDFILELIDLAAGNLGPQEKGYLFPFRRLAYRKRTLAKEWEACKGVSGTL